MRAKLARFATGLRTRLCFSLSTALLLTVTALTVAARPATAQLYMSGAGGVYSNLESSGYLGRFALGAAPFDWFKVEGSVLASGHGNACCSVAADATGWLGILGLGPVSVGLGGGGGVLTYINVDEPGQNYDWTPYFVSGLEAEVALTRHFALTGRAELGLGEIRGYAGLRLGF